jgi:hypothetical protein
MTETLQCPFAVGDVVRFSPSERTRNHYQDIGTLGVKPDQELEIKSIKDRMYLYFDGGIGGWPWNEFTLVSKADAH